jgi:predicted transport protein
VEGYFEGKPAGQREIFDALEAHLVSVGPLIVDPVQVTVMFKRTRSFAEVRSKRRSLTLSFLLSHPIEDGRISKTLHFSATRWALNVELVTVADVDEQVKGWLTEAYLGSPE